LITRVFGACHRLFMIFLHGSLIDRVCNLASAFPHVEVEVGVLSHCGLEFLRWRYIVGCRRLESLE
jgi:hypothetical protein